MIGILGDDVTFRFILDSAGSAYADPFCQLSANKENKVCMPSARVRVGQFCELRCAGYAQISCAVRSESRITMLAMWYSDAALSPISEGFMEYPSPLVKRNWG